MKAILLEKLRNLKHDRYHIPGHKGLTPKAFENPFAIDFTEINETGNLYEGGGVISESESQFNEYFGSHECIYLTGGSTQGIMTAIFEANPKKMLCDRNSHKALCHALAFVDCEYSFVNPCILNKYSLPSEILANDVKECLESDKKIDTVYITSPNYYGITSDIKTISKVCKEHDVTLIVDEAHGCHFTAIGVLNAMKSGADFAITSVHKTAESLGQGACLLTKNKTSARKKASIFGTSSPSYLIMASIEHALINIDKYNAFLPSVLKLREKISNETIFQVVKNDDACRLVINTKKTNISGNKLAEILENEYKIVSEMSDIYNVVFILTYNDKNLEFLFESLVKISATLGKTEENDVEYCYFKPKRAISVRQAMFSEEKKMKLCDSIGEISKEMVCPYPPGVPIIYPGEIILQNHVEYIGNMCYNNNEYIKVVKNRCECENS